MNFYNIDPLDHSREKPPYRYAVPVDVSVNDQTFSGKRICALQSTTAGLVKIDTSDSVGVTITLPAGVPMQIRVSKIYHVGTADGIQSGAITALGFTDDTIA